MKKIALACALFFCITSFSQTLITGTVVDEYDQALPQVNISIKGAAVVAITDFDGFFSFTTSEDFPLTLEIESIGFDTSTEVVNADNVNLKIILKETNFLDEFVVSASRAPERLFESPVSIERLGLTDIKNTPSGDFYGALESIKGVDINTNSLTFKSVNTRGFATFNNNRFVQLVDGMDNTSPSLNFALGNLVGLNELDVENIELLPGASSALYGANAFNGILFMNSKSPFEHEGVSGYARGGITSQEAAGTNPYGDIGVRIAKAFGDKFAAKVNISYFNGTDWFATSEDNIENPGETLSQDPAFNGLNVYGDEIITNIKSIGFELLSAGQITQQQFDLIPQQVVSRTGYNEEDLTDYTADNLKFDVSLNYRPFANDFEIIYVGKLAQGQTIFQDTNRFSLNNFLFNQHKLEIKNDNFFVRGYLSAEDAGDSYNIGFAGININNRWKSNTDWFTEYTLTFANGTGSEQERHLAARNFADRGRLQPGTEAFENAFDDVVGISDFSRGAKFLSETKLRHGDANYNFSHITKDFADIQVGGSFREYELNSSGTVFTDTDGPIKYSEFGAYTQIQKKLIDDRLKLTGSVRYDKSELFDGNFSPRFSIGYTLGAERNRNIRASVQTGFRNPTTQELYLGIDTAQGTILGSAPDNLDRYSNVIGSFEITGRQAYENSFTANSVRSFLGTGATDSSLLEIANPEIVKPERVTAYELGYRAKFGRVIIDFSGYYNQYEDFISSKDVVAPLYGQVSDLSDDPDSSVDAIRNLDFAGFQAITNSEATINSYGVVLGVTTKIFTNFDLGINYTFTEQDFDQEDDPGFRANFNTPKHKVKAMFGRENLFKNFGFNTGVRWSDAYFWESAFATGEIPSYTVIDAQVNYRIPFLKSTLKLGATNIGGDEYFTAIGTGSIGSQYYLGLFINNF
ncbi:TonB-dependent receptor [Aquimarina sp. RZ0]|uniref:TonB-dependent receptor n=1 Tax=Aquimarina sp. RZ0 TaxID=2607730 RepID=UPI0011F0D8FD|nr:TonB-dependent receptor [Aquimarina sp. RZ0]KAA1245286.1 TonB-dependent receptor [Aquimarina sp. RZ0]